MKKIIYCFLFLAFTSGCQPLLLKMYGIKQPEIENEKTIVKKALKFQLDTSNIVTIAAPNYLKEMSAHEIPDGAVFDSKGEYIEFRQTDTSCNAGLFQFVPSLETGKAFNKTGKTNLETEVKKWRDMRNHTVSLNTKADFYLLLYWTVWSGRLNKDHVKIWEDLARANTKCTIKVIKVNLDLQESWDKTERDEIINKLSKKK